MQVSVEATTKLERRITVTVPVTQLEEAFDKRIANLAKTAKVKGFRPGNVPLSHIKQIYGNAARQEALSDVIQSSLYAAIEQEKLNPVGAPPTVEPKNITPGEPLEYVATFEIMPEIETINFEVKKLEKEVSTITDADVEKVIERLCEQHTTWKEVDRAAKDKDQAVIDFRGAIDGEFFAGGEAHDYPLILGSNSMIPGFEEGVMGIKKGEEKVIKVTFPKDYFSKDLAGKVADFTITAKKISEPHVPAMNEDLVKKFGIKSGNIEELRSEIRKNLEREVERLINSKLKAKIFDLLIEQNPIEVPNALIAQEAKRVHDEVHPHHGNKEHHHTEEEDAHIKDAAKRNVMLGVLIGEFVKQKKIKPDYDRVQKHLAKVAAAYEDPTEVIKWYAGDKRRLAEIEMYVLEEQVIEALLADVAVTEKTLSYSELMKA
ncbi:MAG: trigger factor [Gammaproteobacteria bacterium]|nr:trigger factor [Gammaproteobacteria bacterium]